MKKGKFKAIIYLISFTVLLTVGIQVYRNIQNYELNKQHLINEVQQALDAGVDAYYVDLLKERMFETPRNIPTPSSTSDTVGATTYATFNFKIDADSIKTVELKRTNENVNLSPDSLNPSGRPANVSTFTFSSDSLANRYRRLAITKVFLSLTQEVSYTNLNKAVATELARKKIDVDFAFSLTEQNGNRVTYNNPDDPKFVISTRSGSVYVQKNQKLEMHYTNASLAILKRGMTDLIISLLISLTVIGALLYLYRIINQQKQLAEIKNDLISNITHEFKTPIATVATAIEAISHFNTQNDPGKTKKYLEISDGQLKKLNVMVEKLLETATLDTGALELNKTPVNLSLLVHTMIEKYRVVAQEKQIKLLDQSSDIVIEADAFHLENAISNLIDNAIKYGGQHITVSLTQQQHSVQVIVQDDGGFIEKGDKERVFDKFYRVPKGNRHDVKGFGIGLYYTKKIIEKHGGTIELILGPGSTSFEVAI